MSRTGARRAAAKLANPSLACVLVLASHARAASAAKPKGSAVAIVSALSGSVRVFGSGQVPREVELFDRLPAGVRVQTGPAAQITLALRDGTRYALDGETRVLVRSERLVCEEGRVRSLASLPSLPRVLALAPGENVGVRAAAVRIRAVPVQGLHPGDGATTLVGGTVLTFQAVAGAPAYAVRVRSADGATIYQVTTSDLRVPVAPGLLQPGSDYTWEVRTVGRAGPVAEGAAAFHTLSAEAEAARQALAHDVARAGDAAALALLAELDRSLGLREEARRGLQAALAMAPDQKALERDLAALDRSLGPK